MVPCYLVSEFTGNSRLLISTCNEHERVYESKRVRTLFHATHQSYFTLHSQFYRWSSILFYVTFARATDHRLHFTSYRQICFLVVIELQVFTRVERSFPKRYQRKEQTTKDMRLNEATSIDRSTCNEHKEERNVKLRNRWNYDYVTVPVEEYSRNDGRLTDSVSTSRGGGNGYNLLAG